MFSSSRANRTQLKTRQIYFIYSFPCRMKLGKSLQTCCTNFTRTLSFVYKTSRLVRISLLISNLNKEVFLFSRESYFIKAIENFFLVFAQPDINTRGVGRILDSYANRRRSRGFNLHNFLEFSQPLECLYQAVQTQEKSFPVA